MNPFKKSLQNEHLQNESYQSEFLQKIPSKWTPSEKIPESLQKMNPFNKWIPSTFCYEWKDLILKGYVSKEIQFWRDSFLRDSFLEGFKTEGLLGTKVEFFYSRCFGSSCFQTTSGENFPYENSKPKCFHPPRKLWNNTRQNGTNVTQSK